MTLFFQNVYQSSKKYLRLPFGTIQNIMYSQLSDTSINPRTSDSDDMPITLDHNPYEKEKQKCILCTLNIEPDYKNVRMLSQFQSSYTGRIYGRHITGLCKSKQQKVENEILKAQNCGFMAVYHKNPQYLADPKLFDSDHPFRPHKY